METKRVLLFGATGVAGSGVAKACAADPRVSEIIAVTRRPLDPPRPEVREVECADFGDLSAVHHRIGGVDQVFYCLGISASQVEGEAEYRRITKDYALAAAEAVRATSPNAVFHFISGGGTDAESRMMWARVKGETELALRAMPLAVVCWRPGMILAERAPRGISGAYRAAYPVLRLMRFVPALSIENEALGRAMLGLALDEGRREGTLEHRDIRAAAERYERRAAGAPRGA